MKFTVAFALCAIAVLQTVSAAPAIDKRTGDLKKRTGGEAYITPPDLKKRTGGEAYITPPDLKKRTGGEAYITPPDLKKRTGGEAYITPPAHGRRGLHDAAYRW
ncbi:uncharacterized protein C8Q71DRAFT_723558 [Rhodofomes roseus]|uniref:Uncharacterized protein n=1 Tax=Rhodofomes roseus TaxID=34475 RepID=A0ABQ8KHZ5_9APHY|nr:uncharacterized protein C8Q71DRAFT_723558 [Rhodofomes roseus]KAH9837274.1 hypothetical protein C8Q71DRAFT_723558 [Rhodofomes roseus]